MDDYIHNINLKNEKKANKTFETFMHCAQYYPNPCFYNLIKQKETLCRFSCYLYNKRDIVIYNRSVIDLYVNF